MRIPGKAKSGFLRSLTFSAVGILCGCPAQVGDNLPFGVNGNDTQNGAGAGNPAGGVGAGSTDDGFENGGTVCVPTEQYFEEYVLEPILKPVCASCHTESGPAATTRLLIDDSDLGRTKRGVLTVAKVDFAGGPLLVQKPSGAAAHGGGTVYAPGSPEIEALARLSQRLRTPVACDVEPFAETECRVPEPIPARVRVLTRGELDETLRTVFNIQTNPAHRILPVEPRINGFDNSADVLRMQPLRVEQVLLLAETESRGIADEVRGSVECFSQNTDTRTCVVEYLERALPQAFRMKITDAELSPLMALYDGEISRGGSAADAFATTIQGVMVSPWMLYRREIGVDGTLGPYEVAENISYTITGGPPDLELLAHAVDGTIMDAEVRAAEAKRLFATPAGRKLFEHFIGLWLDLEAMETMEKSSTVYPKFSGTSRDDMKESLSLYVEHILDNDGTLESLMTSPDTFWTRHMAELLSGPTAIGGGYTEIGIEESDMLEEPSDLSYATGGSSGESWVIWANGGVVAPFQTEDAGAYEVIVDVFSNLVFGVGADFDVYINDDLIGSGHTDAEANAPEQIVFATTLSEGAHEVTVRFTNDAFDDASGADRNLHIRKIDINGPIGATSSFDNFGAEPTLVQREERPGLLTRAGIMSVHGTPDGSSPIRRGVMIRERVFCQGLPPPSSDVEMNLPDSGEEDIVTTRDRTEAHLTNPSCASCHALIDGLGYAFEGFDGVGAVREEENGAPIDASGSIFATVASDGSFEDVHGFIDLVGTSPEVESCFAKNFRMFSTGIPTAYANACVDGEVLDAFSESNGDIGSLIEAVVSADSFIKRSAQ